MSRVSVALVIPTKDKLEHLQRTLPTNARLGFDEVIVLDSSTVEREGVESLCRSAGVRYIHAPLDRLGARNAGAEAASTDWVCILDDDVVLSRFDLERFAELARDRDFMRGGWGKTPAEHYAWIFRREFFLRTLKGYDPVITGGDDLDITLRAERFGKGVHVFDKGLYDSDAIGLGIAADYPGKWIRNKALYALTSYPLLRRHPQLMRSMVLRDGWRLKRIAKGEPAGRVLFEGFIDRAGTVYSPVYSAMSRRRSRKRRRS